MTKIYVIKLEDKPFIIDEYGRFVRFCEAGEPNGASGVGVKTPDGKRIGYYECGANHGITNTQTERNYEGRLFLRGCTSSRQDAMSYLVVENKGAYHRDIIVPVRFDVVPWNLWTPSNSADPSDQELYKTGEIFKMQRELSPIFRRYWEPIEVKDIIVDELISSAEEIISKGMFNHTIDKYRKSLEKVVQTACRNNKDKKNLWQYLVLDTGINPHRL